MVRHVRYLFVFAVGWLSVAGCGDSSSFETAPVSGTVTLQQEPLPNATVQFQPIAGKDGQAGPGSYGTTDERGEYILRTIDGQPGAVVARHRVMISLPSGSDSESDTVLYIDPRVPAKFRNGNVQCDVPAAGTDIANFELAE